MVIAAIFGDEFKMLWALGDYLYYFQTWVCLQVGETLTINHHFFWEAPSIFRYQTHFWVPMRLTRAPNLAEFERVSVRGRLRCWRAKSVDLIDFKRLFFGPLVIEHIAMAHILKK